MPIYFWDVKSAPNYTEKLKLTGKAALKIDGVVEETYCNKSKQYNGSIGFIPNRRTRDPILYTERQPWRLSSSDGTYLQPQS
jgi:hypothetical protein